MGEVYSARDERLQRNVALKLLPHRAKDSAVVERFLREAQAASALNHPNIVTIHEVGETELGRFIVMELVDGHTLRQISKDRVSVDTLVQLGTQMSRALTVAHSAGITHRDVKPENIMVRNDGYVKILDFGLARLTPLAAEQFRDHENKTVAVTEAGALIGTTRYMSPEQALGRPVDCATDIFSLGIVFYELLTGRHPFVAESALATLNAIAFRPALVPSHLNPDVPPSLDALILRMLDKNPRLRPAAADVDHSLVDLVGGAPHVAAPTRPLGGRMVGRTRERADLATALDAAAGGRGLVLCVAGEPGLGKTSLVEDFLNELGKGGRPCWIARGRCSERLAGAEAYLPFLEALDSMVHGSRLSWAAPMAGAGESVAGLMKLLAPTWYAQVAPLASDQSAERQPAPTQAASQEQMKRELISFFQEVSRIRPLILFLDDIHWADVSTTDLLAYLAARLPSMAMLVVATYRQSDLLLAKHPFIPIKLDLQSRGVCREIALDFLTRDDVRRFVALQFSNHEFPPEFIALIHTKTEGNPLFMVDLLHNLRSRRVIAEVRGRWTLAAALPAIERELPESVRSMIQRKIDQLNEPDRRLLVAASVQGHEFDSTVVARALAADPAEVEERLTGLEHVHAFVRRVRERELPDGSLTVSYRFVHVLYQNALYASLTPTRKLALSGAVANAVVGAYGERRSEVASDLALLFEVARDFGLAAEYFLMAALNAARIFAHNEAVTLSRRGIALVEKLPASADRAARELSLQIALGSQLLATRGFAAAEMGDAYAKARALCDQLGETRQVLPVLLGLSTFHIVRAEYAKGRELSRELLFWAERFQDSRHPTRAHVLLGVTAGMLGEFSTGVAHLEPCIKLETPQDGSWTSVYGAAPGVSSRGYLALILLLTGYPDRALNTVFEGVRLAEDLSHPLSMASSRRFTTWISQMRREPQAVGEQAAILITLSAQQGFPFYHAWGTFERGWALTTHPSTLEAGMAEMREGMTAFRATGAAQLWTYCLALWAEACGKAQQPTEALRTLNEAVSFCRSSGETFYEAELHRLRGDVLMSDASSCADQVEIESCFLEALDIARRQGAKWLELRAGTSLVRLWKRQGKKTEESRALLDQIYRGFTEGFDTPEMRDSKALLDTLT